MKILRLGKLLLVGMFAMLLAACNPFASFTANPDLVVAGQPVSFDASASAVAPKPKNNVAVSYVWDFGDGTTGTGKTTTHIFTAVGTYVVKLSVTDKAGRVGTTSHKVIVKPADVDPVGTTVPLNVSVRGADGALLAGAQVTIGSLSATTSNKGVAVIAQAAAGDDQVLRVSSPGFITQVLSLDLLAGSTPLEVGVRLLAVKETIAIQQAQEAQVLLAKSLGASVTLPANALVNAAGVVATGPITLQLTPWNVDGDDLLAMPGNGEALDAQGARASLISAGMLTVDFFDAAGSKLQLASNASAVIQMNLLFPIINGQRLDLGTEIPMWNFDEARGLWMEEGVGQVVAALGSPTGLALKATVSHFSTWNWGFPWIKSARVVIRCVNAQQQSVACALVANVTLPDGSRFVNSLPIGAATATTTITNMPEGAQVSWFASTAGGLQGLATSVSSGTVVITLTPPTTSNFVQCLLPGGTPVACRLTLAGTTTDGLASSRNYALPVGGATIETSLLTGASLTWDGESVRGFGDQTIFRNVGSAISGPTGTVVVQLGPDEVVVSRTVRLQCAPTAAVYDRENLFDFTVRAVVPVASCDLFIRVLSDGFGEDLLNSLNVPTGVSVQVNVPLGSSLSVFAQNTSDGPTPVLLVTELQRGFDALSSNALYVLRLNSRSFPS